MSETINVTLIVQVVGGPKISTPLEMKIDAYDKVDLILAAGEKDKQVDVQPSLAEQVGFLMINLKDVNQYNPNGTPKVTYKINKNDADPVNLDAPQVFIGNGAVGLLELESPTKLFFSNELDEEVSVQILVGRNVTPP